MRPLLVIPYVLTVPCGKKYNTRKMLQSRPRSNNVPSSFLNSAALPGYVAIFKPSKGFDFSMSGLGYVRYFRASCREYDAWPSKLFI